MSRQKSTDEVTYLQQVKVPQKVYSISFVLTDYVLTEYEVFGYKVRDNKLMSLDLRVRGFTVFDYAVKKEAVNTLEILYKREHGRIRFLTKQEAEAKLKKLEEGRNE